MCRITALAAALALAASSGSAGAGLLPLEPGATWEYRAAVRWTVINSSTVRHAVIHWRMRVVEAAQSEDDRVALVSGFPEELVSDPPYPTRYEVIRENRTGIWVSWPLPESKARALFSHAGESPVPESLEQLLALPVRRNYCNGDGTPDGPAGGYCWRVDHSIREYGHPGWEIAYRTLASLETMRIVPGIGFTRLGYDHHGTVSSASVRLLVYVPPRR